MSVYPQTIWRVPAYQPYVQPPLTEDILRAKEAELGVKFPAEYVAHLKMQNGGYLRWRLPDEVHDVMRGIGPNYPSLERPDWTSSSKWNPFKPKAPHSMRPICRGAIK